jgi:iron complex outermembrane receptor protein
MKLRSLFLSAALSVSASALALEGQILDSNGQAIEGAEVKLVGKRVSTTTDAQGKFDLDITSEAELHIRAVGYVHKTIHVEADELDEPQNITLVQAAIEQMDVIGIPLHASTIESSVPVNVVAGEDLRAKQAATLGDTLANEVGIHTNFHGNVASTPIIRGLSGPRVLITQNSLDVSDVSRVGPDHSVATEVSTAEQVEVLRGPATLFFGSGAIGGVVNVVDQRVPTDSESSLDWTLSHDTVNSQDLASINLNTGTDNLAFHFDGFQRDSKDYEVPVSPELGEDHGERTVASTAEDSSGFTFGTSYLLDNGYVGLSYGKLDREYGIPGHGHGDEEEHGDEEGHDEDHDEEGHEEEGHDDEHVEGEEEMVSLGLKQDRYQLISELSFDDSLVSSLNARIGYTDYEHTEFENGSVGTTFANETLEAKVEILHDAIADWHGGLVVDYKSSDFSAEGEEAFAPPSETDSFAIALLEERHFGDVLIQMGARVERVSISSNEVSIADIEFHPHDEEGHDEEEHDEEEHGEEGHDDDEHGHEEHGDESFAFEEDYTPFSLSLGAVWDFTPGYNFGASVSYAERAPSAAELLSFGPHIATDTFEVGALFEAHEEDDEIHFEAIGGKPGMEKSTNLDLSFRKYEGDVGIILNAFYNKVDNYYAQFDTELFAEFSHDHEEGHEDETHEEEGHDEEGHDEEEGHEEEGHDEEHADAEELPVFVFQSADATIRGIEAQAVWQMNDQFTTSVFADYVRATLDNGGNLARIPPMRYGASLDYVYDRVSANLSWTQYADQDDVADLETSTEGYNWVDARVDYLIPFEQSDLTVFLKVENLMDEEARVHSSFLKDLAPRPGRNIRFGLRGTF